MTNLFLLFFFLLGLIIGSFLNVVIYRYNTGRSIQGRSGCLSCGKKLGALELVPIISFLCLQGKCRGCGSKISWQYPVVEFFTGAIFATIAYKYMDLLFVNIHDFIVYFMFMAIIASLLIVIFVYDIKHKIIPDALVYSFAAFALLYRIYETDFGMMSVSSWLDMFSGIILFIPFFLLWIVSQGRWIGLGDGKLALGIGWLLGFVGGVSSIIVSFWIGAIISVLLMFVYRLKPNGAHITMKTEVPFAPFLIAGVLIAFLYPLDVFNLSLLFNL